jgi:uncharacterized protein YyaL (SSP411 family)
MARESFSDSNLATQLNQAFVCVKLDREERPDIDRVYMAYIQAVTGRGGWPISVWLTPELKPFFGGTYFPATDADGRAGMTSVVASISEGWSRDQGKVVEEASRIVERLREFNHSEPIGEAVPDFTEAAGDAFERGYVYFCENFDAEAGGFGEAPKFPRTSNVDFLLSCVRLQGRDSEVGREALEMVTKSLAGMSMGGIHDVVGGGFHRYAVDANWRLPHFEKMLVDQASIACNYLQAYSLSHDERLAWPACGALDYVLERLCADSGAFLAAQDADSDSSDSDKTYKKEGAYYVWEAAELSSLLGSEFTWFSELYGISAVGNVAANAPSAEPFKGKNVLAQRHPLGAVAYSHSVDPAELASRLAACHAKLKTHRDQRSAPARDEKVVAAWNGAMIAALATAATCPAEALQGQSERYLTAAAKAAAFIQENLWDEESGQLVRSWCNGVAAERGFAEDYAGMVHGLLHLYESSLDLRWLRWADHLQQEMDRRFWDTNGGGYFQAEADPDLILRLKDDYDGAEPTSSSLAANNLLRLSAILHDDAYRRRAAYTLQAFRAKWTEAPWALPGMLTAMVPALSRSFHLTLVGSRSHPEWAEMRSVIQKFGAERSTAVVALESGTSKSTDEAWLRQRVSCLAVTVPPTSGVEVQLCHGERCEMPVATAAELDRLLQMAIE